MSGIKDHVFQEGITDLHKILAENAELKKERDELKLEYDKLEQDFKDVWDGRDQVIRERGQLNLKLTDAVTALEFYGASFNWVKPAARVPEYFDSIRSSDMEKVDDYEIGGKLARQTLLKLKGGG